MARKSPSGKKSKKQEKAKFFTFGRLFRWTFVLALWAGIGLTCVAIWYATELPKIVKDAKFERRAAITVKAEDGSVIARYGDFMGHTITTKDLPPHLIEAVIATEDRRFYKHFGLDPIGLTRAVVVNTVRGGVHQGGSTITQQLAKNLFLTRERTYKRKAQEALLAIWLEWELSKDEIMTAYLNRVYLGSGAFGIEAASQIYFGKTARDLTLRESATIAGLLKAPSRYSPLANPANAAKRTEVVLQAMVDAGFITQEDIKSGATSTTTHARADKAEGEGDGETERYYGDWVMHELKKLIGEPDRDLIVETTMWPEAQEAAESAVERLLASEGKEKNASQAAVILIDTMGAVRAMVGGRDHDASEFNRATQALRQPGSTFKPFVYLTALEAGWSPTDIIHDEPVEFGKYKPQNFKGKYYGPVPLYFALSRSLNSAAVQLANNVGVDAVIRTAHNLGIRKKLGHDMSLALGSNGLPVIEMATAYASIASGGIGVDPYGITRISDNEGNVLYERRAKPVQLYVVSEQSVRNLSLMMRETIDEGTGRRAKIPYLAAGKTGTSSDYRDAWFIGFSGPLVAAVWVGNDDYSSMKQVTGGSIPAAIWHDTMMAAAGVAARHGVFLPTSEEDNAFGHFSGDPMGYNPDLAWDDPRAQWQNGQQTGPESISWNEQGPNQTPKQARKQSSSLSMPGFGEMLDSLFSFGSQRPEKQAPRYQE